MPKHPICIIKNIESGDGTGDKGRRTMGQGMAEGNRESGAAARIGGGLRHKTVQMIGDSEGETLARRGRRCPTKQEPKTE